MEAATVSKETKRQIFTVVKTLIDSKAKRVNTIMRTEYGDAFSKIQLKDFLKIIDRQSEETNDFMKSELVKIYKTQGKEKFDAFVEDAKSYTDDDFIRDIREVFGEDNANFLEIELKRLKYANGHGT